VRRYDLIVLGAGSGNMLFGPELAHLKSAVVEPGRFGGTCLNRGCIPSKMFVVAADLARSVREAERLGVHAHLDRVDWIAIRDRVFGRIDPIHDSAVDYRRSNGIDIYTDPARFAAPGVVDVGGEQLAADRIVVSVGSRPSVPAIPGLDQVPFHTSDTIMRLDSVPSSLLIIGGGFIAAEMGHVFGQFGADVTIVQRGPRLLMTEDEQVSVRFTDLAARRHRLLLDCEVIAVEPTAAGAQVTVQGPAGVQQVEVETILVAAGRTRTRTCSTRPPAAWRWTSTVTSSLTTPTAPRCLECGRSGMSPTTSSSSTWPTPRCASCDTICSIRTRH
jgi:mycothione reductase